MDWVWVFFPGVWVHELSHALACYLSEVKVHRVEIRPHSGLVVHDPSKTRHSFLIALAPLLVGTVVSVLLFSVAKNAASYQWQVGLFWGWLGFSIAFHSIPSNQDLWNIPYTIRRRFSELRKENPGLLTKMGKGILFGFLWPLSVGLALIAGIVNYSLFFRLGWAFWLGWVA